ncbi:MAG: hypothetical protein N2169_04895, partial [bacterium]|nr:hypothetical protein [bacterium]
MLRIFFILCLICCFCYSNPPVLKIPVAGIDDLSVYENYFTVFYKDKYDNVLQIYYDKLSGRLVNLWANSMNESISLTIRNPNGTIPGIEIINAEPVADGNFNIFSYQLVINSSEIEVGHFLLGSMRFERDFQYHKLHLQPFRYIRYSFIPPEFTDISRVINNLSEKKIRDLDAKSVQEIYDRLFNKIMLLPNAVIIEQVSINNKNILKLKITTNETTLIAGNDKLKLLSNDNKIIVTISLMTNSKPLTPINKIFNDSFENFYQEYVKENPGKIKTIDRQITAAYLLCYKEKLFAGLPNFATYFGRDSLMFAIIMNDVITPFLFQSIVEMIILKLSEEGDVSHEESLGFQAIRENVSNIIKNNDILHSFDFKNIDKTVENYIMVDDDFQFPIVFKLYLQRKDIYNIDKIKFLNNVCNEKTYLEWVLKNFSYVFDKCLPFYLSNDPKDLIKFPYNGREYISASWRDSNFGYCKGAYSMDVNVIWVPFAIQSIYDSMIIIDKLQLKYQYDWFIKTNLYKYYKSGKIKDVISKWNGTAKFFEVYFSKNDIYNKLNEKIVYIGNEDLWRSVVHDKLPEELNFLGIALDDKGKVIGLMNTDLSYLFLLKNVSFDELQNFYQLTVLPYPLGLFIDNVGVVCSNDTYTNYDIWEGFSRDHYHSPKVVWGREVNIIMRGLLNQIEYWDKQGRDVSTLKYYFYKIYKAVE